MYQRQVSSSPRSVRRSCRSSDAPSRRRRGSGCRRTGAAAAPVRAAQRAGADQVGAARPSRIQSVRRDRCAVVEHRLQPAVGRRSRSRTARIRRPGARPGRSSSVSGSAASCSPIRVPPPRGGEDAAALFGVAGRRPSSTRRSSGRRRRSAAGSSRTARPAGRSGRAPTPAAAAGRRSAPARRRRRSRGCARPAQAERVRSADLALSSSRPSGWSKRRRSPVEVPRKVERQLVLGEAEQQLVALAASRERRAQRGREVGEHLDAGRRRGRRPSRRRVGYGLDQRRGVLGRARLARGRPRWPRPGRPARRRSVDRAGDDAGRASPSTRRRSRSR